MFTRLFSLLTTDIFIPNNLNVLDRENDKIIKCQILVEIIIIEDNIFHLLWRICVISFISIIYRFQTKWLPRRRSRTRSPLVCIYISLTGKYLTKISELKIYIHIVRVTCNNYFIISTKKFRLSYFFNAMNTGWNVTVLFIYIYTRHWFSNVLLKRKFFCLNKL